MKNLSLLSMLLVVMLFCTGPHHDLLITILLLLLVILGFGPRFYLIKNNLINCYFKQLFNSLQC